MSIHSRTARRKAQGREEHTLHMDAGIYYVWVAGSCDYAHQERCSAGAYIMQLDNKLLHTFTLGDSHTTEFRMILSAMVHAMKRVPAGSDIVFLTNVSYIQQNFSREPSDKPRANADLLQECRSMQACHHSATVKLIPFHKYNTLQEANRLAHQAMEEQRNALRNPSTPPSQPLANDE